MVEQRYQAVLEVLGGTPVTEVALRFGVAQQTVHRWVAGYRESGLDGLADRSHAPKSHPWQVSADVEAVICDLRAAHRGWGPRRLFFELENASGNVSLGDHIVSAGLPLAGQRVTLRLDGPVAHVLAEGVIVRTLACPVPPEARPRLRGARPGTAQPPSLPEPLVVTRRVSVRGSVMAGGQKIQVGLPHAGKTVRISVGPDTYQITVEPGITVTAPRTASRDVRRHKASNYAPDRGQDSTATEEDSHSRERAR